MSSTSDVYVREVRSGLFNIKWELVQDTRESAHYREWFKLSGSYSQRGFKMTYDYVCLSKKHQVIKKNFTVRQIKEDKIFFCKDTEDDSSEDEMSEIAANSDGDIIDEDAITYALHAEASLGNQQQLLQSGETVEDLALAANILGQKSLPPMHIWIYNSEYSTEKTLSLNHDSDVWESKWHDSSQSEVISLWIDFGTRTPRENNVICTMNGVARLFYDQSRCDAEFNFKDEKKIGAHILILSAGSPVFAAMFQSNMLESQTHQVAITDIEVEVFRQLLTHLYTGSAPMLEEDNMTQHLYEAADKYGVEMLKDDCIDAMLKRLRSDNCLNVLVWSHFHSIEKLFESTMIFTVQHFRALCFKQEWSDFMKSFPNICLQVLQRMASHTIPCEH